VPNAPVTSVDGYIAARSAPVRRVLGRVRRAIRAAVPGVEERISYGIPAYALKGRTFLYFAAWKRHYSLYPAGKRLVAAFAHALTPYDVKGSTIRFPLSEPVPSALIARLARFRAKEIAGRASNASRRAR
jgi:uncharacterized protein YdhG (YjbR/CyaY superfamily)